MTYLPQVDSTNRFLHECARHSPVDRMVAVTDFQYAGRGRAGRVWTAPPGTSMLVSVLLRWEFEVPETHATMLAALAVLDAVAPLGIEQLALKWPNDVTAGGRKLSGILTEKLPADAWLVVGCGLNVNFDPGSVPGIPPDATSIVRELGRQVDREQLLAAYLRGIDHWIGCLRLDPRSVFDAWQAKIATLGRHVTVTGTSDRWRGQAVGVQWDGALIVRTEHGVDRAVYAGDISVRDQDFTRT